MQKKISFLATFLMALVTAGCVSNTEVGEHREPLFDANMVSHQVMWTFDSPGLLRADVGEHGQFLIEYGPEGAVLLEPDMTQRLAIVTEPELQFWVREPSGDWNIADLVTPDEPLINSQQFLIDSQGVPGLEEAGLELAGPIFLRAMELISTSNPTIEVSAEVHGHQQPYLAIAYQAAGPSVIYHVLTRAAGQTAKHCNRLSYQRCIDCCLRQTPLAVQGCLLDCER